MTDDIKATRLSKAAREFNVGISTIVEFLHKKGFNLDPNPNTKLPPEAYNLLVKEYSTDISVKKESEKLILKDLHRKKETVSIDDFAEKSETEEVETDEEILIKDISGLKKSVDIKPEIKKPDIKLVGKIDLEKTIKPKVEAPAPKKEQKEEKPVKVTAEAEVKVEEEKIIEKEKDQVKKKTEEKTQKSNIDLHIVGKIDLETVTQEPKPSKKDELKKGRKEETAKEEKKGPPKKEKEKEKEKKIEKKEETTFEPVPEEMVTDLFPEP